MSGWYFLSPEIMANITMRTFCCFLKDQGTGGLPRYHPRASTPLGIPELKAIVSGKALKPVGPGPVCVTWLYSRSSFCTGRVDEPEGPREGHIGPGCRAGLGAFSLLLQRLSQCPCPALGIQEGGRGTGLPGAHCLPSFCLSGAVQI